MAVIGQWAVYSAQWGKQRVISANVLGASRQGVERPHACALKYSRRERDHCIGHAEVLD